MVHYYSRFQLCDKRREKPGTVKFNCVPGPFNSLAPLTLGE